jgi:hypothetical protein
MPLNLIEAQSGPYPGGDDIVRIEDVYNRVWATGVAGTRRIVT